MFKIVLLLTFLIFDLEVNANELVSVKEFCKNKKEYDKCLKDFEGIPSLEEVPSVRDKTKYPIPIKIIPYKTNKE